LMERRAAKVFNASKSTPTLTKRCCHQSWISLKDCGTFLCSLAAHGLFDGALRLSTLLEPLSRIYLCVPQDSLMFRSFFGKSCPHSSRLTTLCCFSAGAERGLDARPLWSRRLLRINVVLHLNRLTGEFKHSFLEFSIGQRNPSPICRG